MDGSVLDRRRPLDASGCRLGVAPAEASEVSTGAMVNFATGFSRAQSIPRVVEELAARVEGVLGGPAQIGGGFLFATAASGTAGAEVGRLLGERWPESSLLGSSFEGIVADGRAWSEVPALGLMAWGTGPAEPIPIFMAPGEFEVEHLAREVLESSGRSSLGPGDLLLLFPDSLAANGLEIDVNQFARALGQPSIAGAAASGLAGGGCGSWIGSEVQTSSTVGILILEGTTSAGPRKGGARVRSAGATRFASPWLEISACRDRWIDGLEGEPPLDWVRRQLGLDPGSSVEPHLDRLLIRLREAPVGAALPSQDITPVEEANGDPSEFIERYVIGIDDRRGSISVPGHYHRGQYLALALPDPDRARTALREAVHALAPSSIVMQFGCRARDESLHGDPDLEPALVAHDARGRSILGILAPFQIGPDPAGAGRMLVYSAVLAAFGDP